MPYLGKQPNKSPTSKIGNGVAEDFAHYRQVVGSINSLEWARDNLTDIIKKRTYGDDD